MALYCEGRSACVYRTDKQRFIRNSALRRYADQNRPHTADPKDYRHTPYPYRELLVENEVQDNEYDQRNTKQPAE